MFVQSPFLQKRKNVPCNQRPICLQIFVQFTVCAEDLSYDIETKNQTWLARYWIRHEFYSCF